jgi:uncharacterized protein (DUF2267 family)
MISLGTNSLDGGMMATVDNDDLFEYYNFIQNAGRLRTITHAERWSKGVLETLGMTIDRRTKRALAQNLPDELSKSLSGIFWLLHFRDPQMSSQEFYQRAARRSGNTDAEFALYPTLAVFGGIKHYIDAKLDEDVSNALSQEVREIWQKAERMKTTV